MKQIHLGSFQLGWENVDLYVFPEEDGGCYYFCPDPKSLPRIKIGLAYDKWSHVLAVLLHESMEYLLERYGYCFKKSGNISGDLSAKWFMLSHIEITEVWARQADFLADAIPALKKAYAKHVKKR